MSVPGTGGEDGKQAIRQGTLEADDEDVVDLADDDITRTNRGQTFERCLDVCCARRHVQQGRGIAVKAQGERPEPVTRQWIVHEDGLDGVGGRHAEARQSRPRQNGPCVEGVSRTDDIERIRTTLEQVLATGAEQVHGPLGKSSILSEAYDDTVTETRHLEVDLEQHVIALCVPDRKQRLLDGRRIGVVRDRTRLKACRRLRIRIGNRTPEPECERAATGVDEDLLLVR